MRTYSITLEGTHHIKAYCYEQVSGISGILEEVILGLVVFHNVKECDINKALDYIANRFGDCIVIVEAETFYRCYCNLEFVIAVELHKPTVYEQVMKMNKRQFAVFCHTLYYKGHKDEIMDINDGSWILRCLADYPWDEFKEEL